MINKQQPQRSCVGCRTVRDKSQLIRLVHTPEGSFHCDPRGKLPGRGAYICPKEECLTKAFKSEALREAFRCDVSAEAKAALLAEVKALGES